jgi:peptidoglycan/xylan/chitin deacetylase (PgdA/CDA1 family)
MLTPLSTFSRRRYIPILLYHSVDTNDSFYSVSPSVFAKQMEYLSRNFSIVTLEEVLEFVIGKRDLPRKSVAITFDDGYHDNYVNVFPHVKKYGFPIAVFVVSGCVGKEMTLGKVPLRMLDWEEIADMSRHNVTIGAHTVTHLDLRRVDLNEARHQMETSKAQIEEVIEQPVNFLAYPKGAYNRDLFAVVKSLNFVAAFAAESDGIVSQGDNRYALKRVSIDASVNFLTFKAKLTIASEWYRKIEKTGGRLLQRLPFLSGIANMYNKHEEYINATG